MSAYEEAGDSSGLTTNLAGILAQVTGLVRGKVAACRDNLGKLGAAGTIPEECVFAAATIARDALVGSLPLSEGATEVRREELRRAHEFLDSVAACKVRVDGEEVTEAATGVWGGRELLEF